MRAPTALDRRSRSRSRALRRRTTVAFTASALLLFISGVVHVGATSEYEYSDIDQEAPSSSAAKNIKKEEDPPPGPATLVRSSVDDATGLRTDTFVKVLGRLVPGEVINTRCECINNNRPASSYLFFCAKSPRTFLPKLFTTTTTTTPPSQTLGSKGISRPPGPKRDDSHTHRSRHLRLRELGHERQHPHRRSLQSPRRDVLPPSRR